MEESLIYNNRYNHAWVLLHYTYDLLVKVEEDNFRRKAGISYSQFLILITMESLNRPTTAIELSRMLQRNPNAVSMILDRMEKSGLVRRVRSRIDRRLVHVMLTLSGKKKMAQAADAGKEFIQQIFADMSEEEVALLNRLLDKLVTRTRMVTGTLSRTAETAAENVRRVASVLDSEKTPTQP